MNDYKIEGRPATIFRTVKNRENPYVMIDRRPIDNKALSWKAKGLLTYLMSRPDGWEVSVSDLVKHSTDGEDSVRSGIHELRKAGHMKYTKARNNGRITGWIIEVYEVPNIEFSPDADFPDVEKPDVVLPDVENPAQVLKTLNNTESSKTDDDDDDDKGSSPKISNPVAEIANLYEQNFGSLTPMIGQFIANTVKDYPIEWIREACKIAVMANARKWAYVEAILDGWKRNGVGWKPAHGGGVGSIAKQARKKDGGMQDTLDMLNRWLETPVQAGD